jgi:hypothetical protein
MRPSREGALHVLATDISRIAVLDVLGVRVEGPAIAAFARRRVDSPLPAPVCDELVYRHVKFHDAECLTIVRRTSSLQLRYRAADLHAVPSNVLKWDVGPAGPAFHEAPAGIVFAAEHAQFASLAESVNRLARNAEEGSCASR